MAYQMTTGMKRYGRGSGTSVRSIGALGAVSSNCVCDSGREWCCAGRLVAGRRYRPMNNAQFTSGLFGDDTPDAETLRDKLTSEPVTTIAAAALTYHGYRRTGSILWAVVYGFAGKTVPLVAVPVSLAQGFGKAKGGA